MLILDVLFSVVQSFSADQTYYWLEMLAWRVILTTTKLGCLLFCCVFLSLNVDILWVLDIYLDFFSAWLYLLFYCIFITLNGFVNSKYIFYILRNVWMVCVLLFNLAFFFVCSFVQWEWLRTISSQSLLSVTVIFVDVATDIFIEVLKKKK